MFILLLIFIPPTALSLMHGLDISFLEGLRKASFDVVSALSTTGYSTMSYAEWPHFAIGVLILMMLADDTTGFIIAYLVIFAIGSLLMTVTANCTLMQAMFDFASSLSTVGLSMGITGPATNDATLIVEMVGMMLGRLEIFIVIIGITFGFRRLKSLLHIKPRKAKEA